jgi:hypothetical protein
VQVITAANLGESKESMTYEGPSGTGKTHNLLTWPTPIKIANFDKNLKTVNEALRRGVDAEIFLFDTFKEFEEEFVAKVRHREFDAQSIGVDTFDFMAALLMRDVQGTKPRLAMADWGTILNKLRSVCSDLTGATAPLGDKPSYNVILNYHLMDVTNDDGALLKTAPKIPGQFKDEIGAYVDTILYCTSQISSTAIKQTGGGTKMVPSKQFLCHTVPPTQYITCKGGGLPPTITGDYPTLRAEWDKGKELAGE